MILSAILDWLAPFLCGGVISGVTAYIRSQKKHTNALEIGVQCLLRSEILRCNEKYMQKKCCPIYEKEALKRAYHAYHTLGGNDVATRLYEEIMALPTHESA